MCWCRTVRELRDNAAGGDPPDVCVCVRINSFASLTCQACAHLYHTVIVVCVVVPGGLIGIRRVRAHLYYTVIVAFVWLSQEGSYAFVDSEGDESNGQNPFSAVPLSSLL